VFETAELGQKVSKQEYRERVPILREALLEAQGRLRKAGFPVIVLFAGVDGAGKGETANLLSEWVDPHWVVTRAFGEPSEEEQERPEYWRFWRDLPPKGLIGIFLSAWYSRPVLDRVYRETSSARYDDQLDRIRAFERTLADDGALILKYWMHLGKKEQKKRFKSLEADPLQSWRVTKRDWDHWQRYDKFIAASERLIMRTSTGEAPWTIVEGADPCYRSLRVGDHLLREIERRLSYEPPRPLPDSTATPAIAAESPNGSSRIESIERPVCILSKLDMSLKLNKRTYSRKLNQLQGRLNKLHRKARDGQLSTILVFEGWDAAGKGGAIRRVTASLDARDYQVIPTAAPTDEERAQHYLWRFWRRIPRAGRVTIFDRSWYGRVLVERVEGFASDREWRRAYSEINDFEQQLGDHGIVLVKFWVHITREEQEARFKSREETPYKRWKLNDEDWRNRQKWDLYEVAAHRMIERTSTRTAPWVLVEGNDKRYARIKVLERVCYNLEQALG